jgi:hypothetical protein
VHVAIDVGLTQTWADINGDMHQGKTIHYLQFIPLQNSLAYRRPQFPVLNGSSNLIQTLLEHDLVDEFWLKIFPVTLGMGKRLFDKGTMPASYTLVETKSLPSGVIIANFKRVGGVKTGSF